MYLILREVVGKFYEMLFNDAGFVVSGVSLTLGSLMVRRTLSVFLRVSFGCSVGVYVAGEMVFIWTWIWHFFG
jgi:hypothetical protein